MDDDDDEVQIISVSGGAKREKQEVKGEGEGQGEEEEEDEDEKKGFFIQDRPGQETPLALSFRRQRSTNFHATEEGRTASDAWLREKIIKLVMERLEITDRSDIFLTPIPDSVNPEWDRIANTYYPRANQIIAFHGTTKVAARDIQFRNFQEHEAFPRGPRKHFFFATDPRVSLGYAKYYSPKKDKDGEPARKRRHMIISKLIYAQDAHISITGCTGGSIKVDVKHVALVKPIYWMRFHKEKKAHLEPKVEHGSKTHLETDQFKLKEALEKHLLLFKKGAEPPRFFYHH